MPVLVDTLQTNLLRVRAAIAAAARRAGRDPSEVSLVAVTKTVPAAVAAELVRLGQRDLGENRADVLEEKAAWFDSRGFGAPDAGGPRWHFVGHLQRNKARRVVERAHVVHSVDSLQLLETLDRIAVDVGRSLDVYLQVKLHPEPTKSGFALADVPEALTAARAARRLRLVGLMAMAPLVEDDEVRRVAAARETFTRLAAAARELSRTEPAGSPALGTSMGMSEDFEVAIEAGSTCVRVGSALFAGLDAGAGRNAADDAEHDSAADGTGARA